MSDLTEFLLARIAEDEWDARRALGLDLAVRLKDQAEHVAHRHGSPRPPPDEPNAADRLWWTAQDVVQWLAPYGPARVLAECEAKRRIVESFADAEQAVATYDHDNPIPAYWQEWGNRHALASVLESLALPYAAHPAYDEAWRP